MREQCGQRPERVAISRFQKSIQEVAGPAGPQDLRMGEGGPDPLGRNRSGAWSLHLDVTQGRL